MPEPGASLWAGHAGNWPACLIEANVSIAELPLENADSGGQFIPGTPGKKG